MNDLPLFAAHPAFLIEAGVPVTSDRASSRHAELVRVDLEPTFTAMRPGDSFAFRPDDCNAPTLLVAQNYLTSAVAKYCRGFTPEARPKFTTRQQGGRFVRCWRLS